MTLTRELGRTGQKLNAIGLGCMGMSEFYGATDDAESLKVLHHAMELGVNMLDTADMYGSGHNEELLGRFLQETSVKPFIATKFGITREETTEPGVYQRGVNNSPAYVKQACEASLKRLGVEVIDLYYAHRYLPDYPLEDMVGAMAELVQEGKVRYLGLSEVSAGTLRRASEIHPISALQTEYSLQTRDIEAEILPTCQELGVSLVAYSPLGRGMLSGAIQTSSDLAEDDFRRVSPRFAEGALKANLERVHQLETIAEAHGVKPAQIALAWVLHQGENVFVIPGTKRISYLETNIAAGEIRLSTDDLSRLDALFKPGSVVGTRYPEAGLKIVNT